MNTGRTNKISRDNVPLLDKILKEMNEFHERKYTIERYTTTRSFHHNVRSESPIEIAKQLKRLEEFGTSVLREND